MDETSLNLLKVVEDRDIAVKELSQRLEGYHTVARGLLDEINSNLVSGQTSSVGGNFDFYEIKVGKLVRRTDLLENSSLNQYLNK